MLVLLALLLAEPVSPPPEPLAGKVQAAIWRDLQVNALIGNGNEIAALWYNAGSQAVPNLHIRDLQCASRGSIQQCSFTLLRDGGVARVLGEEAPDELACDALFIRSKEEDDWAVKHIPPRHVGHSQTTMQCKAILA